jgi:hypothetical protein
MENQTLYYTHGPDCAYIVRPDGKATYYADYKGWNKQEIINYATNVLEGTNGFEPCDLATFTEIKWRVIRKMQEGGAL